MTFQKTAALRIEDLANVYDYALQGNPSVYITPIDAFSEYGYVNRKGVDFVLEEVIAHYCDQHDDSEPLDDIPERLVAATDVLHGVLADAGAGEQLKQYVANYLINHGHKLGSAEKLAREVVLTKVQGVQQPTFVLAEGTTNVFGGVIDSFVFNCALMADLSNEQLDFWIPIKLAVGENEFARTLSGAVCLHEQEREDDYGDTCQGFDLPL